MDIGTTFFQQVKHTLNIPLCCAFNSRCLLALQMIKIPPLLYSLPDVPSCCTFPLYNLGSDLMEKSSINERPLLSRIVVGFV
jgi:hypothetical protein